MTGKNASIIDVSVDNDLHSDHPPMSTNEAKVECVEYIVRSDGRKSVNQFVSEGRISVRSCHGICHDVLNMRLVCQQLVAQNNTSIPKQHNYRR